MKFKLAILFVAMVSMSAIFPASAQTKANDPWKSEQLMEPQILAAMVSNFPADKLPVILNIGPADNIKGAVNIGPAAKEEGLKVLEKALKGISKDKPLVIYCGCCPMYKCPNIRPAYRALVNQGFTNVRVLNLANNLKTDWIEKNYPIEQK